MWRLPDPKHADKLVLAAVERALAGARFHPHRDVDGVSIDRLGGCHQLGNVPPVGADIMKCTVARHRCCGIQSNAEEAHVIRARHLSARDGELGVLYLAATTD